MSFPWPQKSLLWSWLPALQLAHQRSGRLHHRYTRQMISEIARADVEDRNTASKAHPRTRKPFFSWLMKLSFDRQAWRQGGSLGRKQGTFLLFVAVDLKPWGTNMPTRSGSYWSSFELSLVVRPWAILSTWLLALWHDCAIDFKARIRSEEAIGVPTGWS